MSSLTRLDGSLIEISRDVPLLNQDWSLTMFDHYLGYKAFEGENHLGNVLTVCSDAKLAIDKDNDGFVDHYRAKVLIASDYYWVYNCL